MIYLAAPYSHPDPAVKRRRFDVINEAAAVLIGEGRIIFSPISMSHPIDPEGTLLDAEGWYAFDEHFMALCSECVVLTIPGWKESVGVAREIEWFRAHRRPITYRGAMVE